MSNSETTHIPPIEDGRKPRLKWARLSYASRLTISFAAIAAMTAMVAIGVLSFVWEQYFHEFASENVQQVADRTAEQIAENYNKNGDWARETYAPAISNSNSMPQFHFVVIAYLPEGDKPKWDSREIKPLPNDEFSDLLRKQSGEGEVRFAKIISDEGMEIGEVRVWVKGSDTTLTQSQIVFRDNSYQAMIFATIVAIVLASCIGFLFARNFVTPIHRMTKVAQAIKEGDLSARTKMTGDDEIARLAETFDEMADSVEKDRELERRLTTDVAHELRTPLMAIQSTVEAMVDGVFDPDVERLETLNSEVQRLSRLVDALLKLSRLENRATPLKEEKVNVAELIAGLVATHEAFVRDSGLSMEFEASDGVYVYGDADMIRQATANLISNAVRYTPEGGKITVKVKQGDLMASIAVADTGIGLSAEEARMVFSRFWRAEGGRNRAQGGLGVGLAVVKEIVDRHGGWVRVEGKPDQGAIFTIYIPLYDEEKIKRRNKNREKAKSKTKK